MSFIQYLIRGFSPVSNDYQRSSFPQDEFEELEPTFYTYEGMSSKCVSPLEERDVYIIDGAIKVTTVASTIRNKALKFWNENHHFQTLVGRIFLLGTLAGGIGAIVSTAVFTMAALAAVCSAVAILALMRASQAQEEYNQWQDPKKQYCEMRRDSHPERGGWGAIFCDDARKQVLTIPEQAHIGCWAIARFLQQLKIVKISDIECQNEFVNRFFSETNPLHFESYGFFEYQFLIYNGLYRTYSEKSYSNAESTLKYAHTIVAIECEMALYPYRKWVMALKMEIEDRLERKEISIKKADQEKKQSEILFEIAAFGIRDHFKNDSVESPRPNTSAALTQQLVKAIEQLLNDYELGKAHQRFVSCGWRLPENLAKPILKDHSFYKAPPYKVALYQNATSHSVSEFIDQALCNHFSFEIESEEEV